MAIRVSYTPYGAVGGLAEHAGQAQQAIREQQYAEQEADQARSIAAQKEMQATQIGASREEWQRKLETQQEQFAMNQALQQEQVFRQQQASEFATMKQAQVQQQQMLANKAAQEQSFELQQAQEARLLQSAQAATQATQTRQAFDFKKLEVSKEVMSGNLEDWKKMQGVVSPEEYTAGMIAISQGRVPRIRAETNALIQEKRELDIEKKKMAMSAGLTDRGRAVAQEVFEDVFGGYAGAIRGAWTGMSEADLIGNYKSYQVKTGYDNKNDASKRELDNVFDVSIVDYENKGWFDYYSAWDPESRAVENLRVQSKGVINDADATMFMNKAIAANPGKSTEECKSIAIDMALKAGYKL